MHVCDLSKKDVSFLKEKGFDKNQINEQIMQIRTGLIYSELDRPASLNDGIVLLSNVEENFYLSLYNEIKDKAKIIKFVPASGAASRMFLDLLTYYNNEEMGESEYIKKFVTGIEKHKFAFIHDLDNCMHENGYNLMTCIKNRNIRLILKYLLTEYGLNYAYLPKAVLKFHLYKNEAHTPIDEHISEGINYALSMNEKIRIHFTISSKFGQICLRYIDEALNKFNNSANKLDITLSKQKGSTDTIILDKDNELYRSIDGNIVFRPGGHGALIENLNELDGDIIFIKNIDNVVVRKISEKTNFYKKVLCGYLINTRNQIFNIIRSLENNTNDDESILKVLEYCEKSLNISFKKDLFKLSIEEKTRRIRNKLMRPIRVCGMVKNEGEPGGGPFWVKKNGDVSLQIIESASVNISNINQMNIFRKAEYFNPVDIVCSVKNNDGIKYDLKKFIDNETFFVSEKSIDGKLIKALELPGLWNGGMADWITIFVEVPLITFNPVKTVNDLLKQTHVDK